MAKLLDGKVAIVTGASRNLGRAFSEMLAADGASVVIHYNDPNKRLMTLLLRLVKKVPK